jgi:hypothetical protein
MAGPSLVRRGKRLIATPQVAEGARTGIDVAQLIEQERHRWPVSAAPAPIQAPRAALTDGGPVRDTRQR